VIRLLTFLIMLAFVATQAASMEEAMCRHASAAAHALALRSADKTVAVQALGEDDAASVVGKKGDVSHGGSFSAPTDMVAPPSVALPFPFVERVRRMLTDAPALASISIPPLLQPPLS
jgi:hypothetical protein